MSIVTTEECRRRATLASTFYAAAANPQVCGDRAHSSRLSHAVFRHIRSRRARTRQPSAVRCCDSADAARRPRSPICLRDLRRGEGRADNARLGIKLFDPNDLEVCELMPLREDRRTCPTRTALRILSTLLTLVLCVGMELLVCRRSRSSRRARGGGIGRGTKSVVGSPNWTRPARISPSWLERRP
jgi:hypothetical protein